MSRLWERINLKMDVKSLIKKVFNSTCIIFTVITAVYMLILQIMNITKISASVEAYRVLLFFIFALLLSCANMILSIEKIHTAARYMFHYFICVLGFWLCFCLPNKMRAATVFVGIVFFTIGYAIVMPIIATFKRRLKKSKTASQKNEMPISKVSKSSKNSKKKK